MIKINNEHLLNNINKIIKENRQYGSSNIGNKKNINISLSINNKKECLNINNVRNITYIDNLERLLKFTGYNVTKELYINQEDNNSNLSTYQTEYILNTKYNTLKKGLDKYRISFTNYKDISTLSKNDSIEKTLTNLRYTDTCYIKENTLYLKTTKYKDTENRILIDINGNYTNIITNITYHITRLQKEFDNYITINTSQVNNQSINASLQILGYPSNILNIKTPEQVKISEENISNLTQIIQILGINKVRYYFSNKPIDKYIHIDIELALEQSNENEIYFIEKTYSKICSILEKYKNKINYVETYKNLSTSLIHSLLNKLYIFPDIIKQSSLKEEPYYILEYIKVLISTANSFIEEEQIITNDNDSNAERLNLLLATKIVINNALDLIGIIPKEQM